MKKSNSLIVILVVFVTAIVIGYILFKNALPSHSEFDVIDKPNDKVVNMVNEQIERQIENHTQNIMHPGYIPESRQNTIDYLKTIKTIESYARHGVESTQPRNYLELKITFNDGTVAEKVYTGHPCSGYMSPCLLLKVEMENGKAIHVFTNGQEKKGSPDWIINDLNTLIKSAISYDMSKNQDNYFAPEKTQKDFDKEWENQK
ncbi:hypothetical protein [Chryseobacterium oryctis]|uniref:Uncharacterized protein n=1 Tax=Chryseobacterium oryctis TaxID=2952618 RepID=A0ABT3HJ23_9FLAO|nr:hypothetical protein [Chryseobacterium oryctis]MCW3159781.1 hypothetical protein [Chryseobacterium oryctis]